MIAHNIKNYLDLFPISACSLLPTPYSLLPVPCSLFPVPFAIVSIIP
ncbi:MULTISPECIES: hypothetical protein [unclassified Moorena]|nr:MULTISPECIES: hypothetical protein [unclassified Moorena]